MKQPIANILFKLSPESTIQLKNITPAQLMFLIAMHRQNAGGNPVVKLTEIPEKSEDEQIKKLEAEIKKLESSLENAETDPNITDEIRNNRSNTINSRIIAKQNTMAEWKAVRGIRELNAVRERERLSNIYDSKSVKAFYPGGVPVLPKDFAEAQEMGLETEVAREKFMVGQDKLTAPANA